MFYISRVLSSVIQSCMKKSRMKNKNRTSLNKKLFRISQIRKQITLGSLFIYTSIFYCDMYIFLCNRVLKIRGNWDRDHIGWVKTQIVWKNKTFWRLISVRPQIFLSNVNLWAWNVFFKFLLGKWKFLPYFFCMFYFLNVSFFFYFKKIFLEYI